jgi:hypothetical protein
MAVKELNAKEQHYADTILEAEKVVSDAKEDMSLIAWKITEKHNKYGQYFLVDLTFSYETPKEIMENAASSKESEPEDQHEGIEYSVDGEGNVAVSNEQEDDE